MSQNDTIISTEQGRKNKDEFIEKYSEWDAQAFFDTLTDEEVLQLLEVVDQYKKDTEQNK